MTEPAKKATKTTTKKAAATTVTPPGVGGGFRPGQLVKHTYDDIPTGRKITTRGIITDITDDGAYVAPLESAAVIPLDQLRAL